MRQEGKFDRQKRSMKVTIVQRLEGHLVRELILRQINCAAVFMKCSFLLAFLRAFFDCVGFFLAPK